VKVQLHIEGEFPDCASLVDDLRADSVNVMELDLAFESAFDITIPDEEFQKICTVADAVKYVEFAKKRQSSKKQTHPPAKRR